MFGLNDNNSQTADNSNPAPAAEPPAMPANPFGDNDAPVPPPAAPAEAAQTLPPSPPPQDTPVAPTTDVAPAPTAPTGSGDLLDLKQEALQSLQPLVSHLEQSPEEKFKTTMMLIQATDNSALVRQAYEAANQITDEKTRAQALLDVVNEINYFTHKNSEAEPKPN
jgi:hypothetical protein